MNTGTSLSWQLLVLVTAASVAQTAAGSLLLGQTAAVQPSALGGQRPSPRGWQAAHSTRPSSDPSRAAAHHPATELQQPTPATVHHPAASGGTQPGRGSPGAAGVHTAGSAGAQGFTPRTATSQLASLSSSSTDLQLLPLGVLLAALAFWAGYRVGSRKQHSAQRVVIAALEEALEVAAQHKEDALQGTVSTELPEQAREGTEELVQATSAAEKQGPAIEQLSSAAHTPHAEQHSTAMEQAQSTVCPDQQHGTPDNEPHDAESQLANSCRSGDRPAYSTPVKDSHALRQPASGDGANLSSYPCPPVAIDPGQPVTSFMDSEQNRLGARSPSRGTPRPTECRLSRIALHNSSPAFFTPTKALPQRPHGLSQHVDSPASDLSSPASAWHSTASPAQQRAQEGLGESSGPSTHWEEATALVGALTQQMQIDPSQLTAGERVQLITVVLQAWQTFQKQGHHEHASRLHVAANKLSEAHNELVHQGLSLKQLRHRNELERERLSEFRAVVADCLFSGLAVMLAAALYCGFRYGYLGSMVGQCAILPVSTSWSYWRPWAVLEVGKTALCYASATSSMMGGIVIMLGVTYYVGYRSSVLDGAHAMPLQKLVWGLSVLCGAAGYLAVGHMGGNAAVWLALWEAWVGLHLIVAWFAPEVHQMLYGPEDAGPAEGKVAASWHAVKLPLYYLVMAVLLPLGMGVLPFEAQKDVFWSFAHLMSKVL